MNVLVLEASTSAAKAMVYSKSSGVLRVEVSPYSEAISTSDTHDAQGVFKLLMEVGCKASSGFDISSVAIVGTWHSLLLCRNNQPKTPVYTWAYTGAADAAQKIHSDSGLSRRLYEKTGCMPHASYPFYKLIYLKEQIQNIDDYDIFGLGEYIFTKITDVRGVSLNMASGTGLMNKKSLDWDDEILELAGISRNQLPSLFSHNHHFPLNKTYANVLGISVGIPVTLPYADGCMNQLGVGAFRPGVMTMSIGTSCAIRCITDSPLSADKLNGLWEYYALDNWIIGAATSGGTNCVDWFQKTMGNGLSLKELDNTVHAEDIPVFLPFLYGERCPGWDASRRGGFLNLSSSHDAGSMYSALLEGILFNVFQCYEQLRQTMVISKINLSGGILYSPVWKQMAADIWGQDMYVPDTEQASMLGGACMGLHALKQIDSLTDFVQPEYLSVKYRPKMQDYYKNQFQKYLNAYK